ncbi:phage tail assembly chaperone [Vibrio atlanticus]|uniref:phage tail assembly chaperone n=1 Tax=Vibrio atlanticus TaxID=693153 RepID=UPI003551F426
MWKSSYGEAVKSIQKTLLVEANDLVESAIDKGVDASQARQYRQTLRDIPQTYTKPEDVVWPQKPSLPQASA